MTTFYLYYFDITKNDWIEANNYPSLKAATRDIDSYLSAQTHHIHIKHVKVPYEIIKIDIDPYDAIEELNDPTINRDDGYEITRDLLMKIGGVVVVSKNHTLTLDYNIANDDPDYNKILPNTSTNTQSQTSEKKSFDWIFIPIIKGNLAFPIIFAFVGIAFFFSLLVSIGFLIVCALAGAYIHYKRQSKTAAYISLGIASISFALLIPAYHHNKEKRIEIAQEENLRRYCAREEKDRHQANLDLAKSQVDTNVIIDITKKQILN